VTHSGNSKNSVNSGSDKVNAKRSRRKSGFRQIETKELNAKICLKFYARRHLAPLGKKRSEHYMEVKFYVKNQP